MKNNSFYKYIKNALPFYAIALLIALIPTAFVLINTFLKGLEDLNYLIFNIQSLNAVNEKYNLFISDGIMEGPMEFIIYSGGLYLYGIYLLILQGCYWGITQNGTRKDFFDMLPMKKRDIVLGEFIIGVVFLAIPFLIWTVCLIIERQIGINIVVDSNVPYSIENIDYVVSLRRILLCYIISLLCYAVLLLLKRLTNSAIMLFISFSAVIALPFIIYLTPMTLFPKSFGTFDKIVCSVCGDIGIHPFIFTVLIAIVIALLLYGTIKIAKGKNALDTGSFRYRTAQNIFLGIVFWAVFIIGCNLDFYCPPIVLYLFSALIAGCITYLTYMLVRSRKRRKEYE